MIRVHRARPPYHLMIARKVSEKIRKSFGSFHADNVEELINLNEVQYQRPAIYNTIHNASLKQYCDALSGHTSFAFGSSVVRDLKLFPLDVGNWTFLNHGAFGATLSPILHENRLWREYEESQPLRFFDRDLFGLLVNSLREMANLLNCNANELFPFVNVTQAMNFVLHSLPIEEGDELIHFNLTYGSTKKMIRHYAAIKKAHIIEINLTFPVSSAEEIVNQVKSSLSPRSKVIVIDHITSNSALELPIKAIAKAVKEGSNQSIFVIVDAAHSLFSQSICLSKGLDPLSKSVDFWVTNGHKWFSAGKGAALLWISSRIRHIKPMIISHGFTSHDSVTLDRQHLLSSLIWDGCRDYISFITLPSTKHIWDLISIKCDSTSSDRNGNSRDGEDGWEVFRAYSQNLLENAESLFVTQWRLKQEYFLSSKNFRKNNPFRLIPLPAVVAGMQTRNSNDKDAFILQELLHHHHQIEIPVKCINGSMYVRISAHIYNELSDYEKLADCISTLSK